MPKEGGSRELANTAGLHLRAFRQERGWSQEKLADKAGTTTQSIGNYERGRTPISLEVLQRVADALEIPAHRFLQRMSGFAEGGQAAYAADARDSDEELLQQAYRALDAIGRRLRSGVV